MGDLFDQYQSAVQDLLNKVEADINYGISHQYFQAVLLQQNRLFENIAKIRKYGDSENLKFERNEILNNLNRISIDAFSAPFFSGSILTSNNPLLREYLPLRLTETFVGRSEYINILKSVIHKQSVTPVAVLGIGGVGKTSLALKAIEEFSDEFPGGVLWADFPSYRGDAIGILNSWAQLLDHPEIERIAFPQVKAQVTKRILTSHVNTFGNIIVVFDDIRETEIELWLDSAHLLRSALPSHALLIITTRQLEIAQSLKAEIVRLDELDKNSSQSLLSTLLVSDEYQSQVEMLSQYVGNLPLAIEIIAGVVKAEGLEWLTRKISDPKTRLKALRTGNLKSKMDSVQYSFELSYAGLDKTSQNLFQLLGIFASEQFETEWVTGVINELKNTEFSNIEDIDDTLKKIHSRGIVSKLDDKRYRFHPLIHNYAYMLLTESNEIEHIANAYVRYFLGCITAKANDLNTLGRIAENTTSAIKYAYRYELWSEVVQIVQNFATSNQYLYAKGMWSEALRLITLGIEASRRAKKPTEEILLLIELGTLQRELGDYSNAVDTFDMAVKQSQHLNHSFLEASALMGKGYVFLYKAQYPEAKEILNSSVSKAQQSGNDVALGEALRGLSRVDIAVGNLEQALINLQSSIAPLEQAKHYQGLAYAYRALSEIYNLNQQIDKALEYSDKGLWAAQEIQDIQAEAYILRGLGDIYLTNNDLDMALNKYIASERLYRNTGDRAALSGAICSIGELLLAQGQLDDAYLKFVESEQIAFEVQVPRWKARSVFGRAKIEYNRGNLVTAIELANQALDELKSRGHRDAQLIHSWLNDLDVVKLTTVSYDTGFTEYHENTRLVSFFEGLDIELNRFIKLLNGDQILDVGFGSGRDSLYFAEKGLKPTGIELALSSITSLAHYSNLPMACMDMRNLGFYHQAFDGIWCCASLLHLRKGEVHKCLTEFNRTLKKEGLLYISVKQGKGEEWVSKGNVGKPRFFSYYSVSEITQLVQVAGFNVKEIIVRKQDKNDPNSTVWISVFARKLE